MDLGVNIEEINTLIAEVLFSTKSHMIAIRPSMPPVVKMLHLCDLKFFDLFVKDDEKVSITGNKRGHDGEI